MRAAMTLAGFAVALACIAVVVTWRLESKLNQILSQVRSMSENLYSVEQHTQQIGESVSSVAINIATRK